MNFIIQTSTSMCRPSFMQFTFEPEQKQRKRKKKKTVETQLLAKNAPTRMKITCCCVNLSNGQKCAKNFFGTDSN